MALNVPVLGSVNWLWLIVGIVLGWFVLPRVTAMVGI